MLYPRSTYHCVIWFNNACNSTTLSSRYRYGCTSRACSRFDMRPVPTMSIRLKHNETSSSPASELSGACLGKALPVNCGFSASNSRSCRLTSCWACSANRLYKAASSPNKLSTLTCKMINMSKLCLPFCLDINVLFVSVLSALSQSSLFSVGPTSPFSYSLTWP